MSIRLHHVAQRAAKLFQGSPKHRPQSGNEEVVFPPPGLFDTIDCAESSSSDESRCATPPPSATADDEIIIAFPSPGFTEAQSTARISQKFPVDARFSVDSSRPLELERFLVAPPVSLDSRSKRCSDQSSKNIRDSEVRPEDWIDLVQEELKGLRESKSSRKVRSASARDSSALPVRESAASAYTLGDHAFATSRTGPPSARTSTATLPRPPVREEVKRRSVTFARSPTIIPPAATRTSVPVVRGVVPPAPITAAVVSPSLSYYFEPLIPDHTSLSYHFEPFIPGRTQNSGSAPPTRAPKSLVPQERRTSKPDSKQPTRASDPVVSSPMTRLARQSTAPSTEPAILSPSFDYYFDATTDQAHELPTQRCASLGRSARVSQSTSAARSSAMGTLARTSASSASLSRYYVPPTPNHAVRDFAATAGRITMQKYSAWHTPRFSVAPKKAKRVSVQTVFGDDCVEEIEAEGDFTQDDEGTIFVAPPTAGRERGPLCLVHGNGQRTMTDVSTWGPIEEE